MKIGQCEKQWRQRRPANSQSYNHRAWFQVFQTRQAARPVVLSVHQKLLRGLLRRPGCVFIYRTIATRCQAVRCAENSAGLQGEPDLKELRR